ncbi:MAG: ScpA family protein [Gemmatimonadota bacterium]
MTSHSVKLSGLDFEGPLDLLVYLVQKNELDIYNIPIAEVTEQFLAYVEGLTPERLESAGEFVLMAATLLRIKAQMLLPRPMRDDEEELADPRRELVMRIIEYQQYREIADHLRDHEASQRLIFPRGMQEEIECDPTAAPGATGAERRASLNDLLRAFAEVMREAARERVHRLEPLSVSIEEKADFVRDRLRQAHHTTLRELFLPEESRTAWIVTFVALLEMAREGEIRLRQGPAFGEIYVYGTAAEGSP